MIEVEPLVEMVRPSISASGGGTEAAVFGNVEASTIAEVLERHVEASLGPVESALFYRSGVGVVAGVRLADGRSVVVKVHRWNASVDRLEAVHRVRQRAAAAGVPAPRPFGPPTPLGHGIATIEEYVAAASADGGRPTVRQRMAASLHRLIEAVRGLAEPSLGGPAFIRPIDEPLWAEPHDVRFDFERTAVGAEWIDAAADRARQTLASVPSGPSVIGHFDWRTENLGFVGDDVAAIYDWDSLGVAAEPVVVGAAAAQFTANWRSDHDVPSPEESEAFVADYEAARGRPFTGDELQRLDAASTALIAYGARCHHSDLLLRPDLAADDRGGWIGLLRARSDSGGLL